MTRARELATCEEIIKAVRPADQVVKIVYDGLIEMLGGLASSGRGEKQS